MIFSINTQRIFLVEHRVDFRLGHQGLLGVAYRLGLNPLQGNLLVFIGKNRRRIKVLFADQTGLWLSTKQFSGESIKTDSRFLLDPSCKEISQAELAMLLE
jgi:hypothetical protein